jgi:hypothetical protein
MPKAKSHRLQKFHCYFMMTALYSGKQKFQFYTGKRHRHLFCTSTETARISEPLLQPERFCFLSAVRCTINSKILSQENSVCISSELYSSFVVTICESFCLHYSEHKLKTTKITYTCFQVASSVD